MKKLFAVLLALTLVLSMGTIALAAGTGTITISNAVDGTDYDAYRIFDLESYDAQAGNYAYKLSAKWAGFEANDYFIINDAGYVEWQKSFDDDSADIKAFVELAIAYAKDNSIEKDGTAKATGDTATISGLDLGYYLVDTSLGALCAITTTNPAAEVTEKNAKPDLIKKIIENGNPVDANNVAIGDTVDYKTTITVGKGLVDYVVHDKMSDGLTFNEDVKVFVDGIEVTEGFETNYDPTDDCTFEVTFDNDYIKGLDKGKEIEITYSANLNAEALIGATGNTNTAQLEYKNEDTVENTLEDTVITYTTEFTVEKVDGNDNPLAGAGFTLYKLVGADNWEAVGDQKVIDALADDEKALYTWSGLEEGQYKLVETKIPDGYNKAQDIEFTITCAEPVKVDSVNDTANWDETQSDQVTESKDAGDNLLDIFEAKVENKTGSLLPETGGIGTTIFYIVGIVMMLGAAIILVSKKRMASFA